MTDIISEPLKFLGATVLSFNSTLGLGPTQESTLNVDLVEDCEAGDLFWPIHNPNTFVGCPVYFGAGTFNFGGILTNWTANQGSSGKTYNVKATDPKQLLENCSVVIDTYLGAPAQGVNYFNVYNLWESEVLDGNCSVFGSSGTTDRGMPYQKIITALMNMSPTIYSPTGYAFTIDFSTFPTGLPDYYRVAGPSITLLQLLQDVCDVLGLEFYVDLYPGEIIKVGLIDLKQNPGSFAAIVGAYDGYATELSYGQELRNETTRSVIFGEKQHYLSAVNIFNYYFGTDNIGGTLVPVIPYRQDTNGFWISKKIDSLNLSLTRPIASNGPFTISELDIRAAMASMKIWKQRVFNPQIAGSFNAAVRATWPEAIEDLQAAVDTILLGGTAIGVTDPDTANRAYADALQNPKFTTAQSLEPQIQDDLDKVFSFIKNLGTTYYGKQFFCKLNQRICYYAGNDYQEIIYSDIPTNDGGWIEFGNPVLGLSDPSLGVFRSDDNRIASFAVFSNDASNIPPEDQEDSPEVPPPSGGNYDGEIDWTEFEPLPWGDGD